MDRQIVYPGQIPLETDLLNTNRNTMIALGKLAGAILGTGGIVNGLAVAPTSPASLSVSVGAGEIYQLANVDDTAYSSLPADTTDTVVKQGILLQPATLSCPAPSTSGFSIDYLIEAKFEESDTGSVVLPYYNASNPQQAFSGPNNTGAAQAVTRAGTVSLQAKAGIAATTGTQTAPSVDAGYIALAVVTVANGQSTIVFGNIVASIGGSLPASLMASIQAGLLNIATDTGSANAYACTFAPAITALTDGLKLSFQAVHANTGASTFNVNGLGAKPIVGGAHAALQGGEIVAGGKVEVIWSATLNAFVLVQQTGGATQVVPAAQSAQAVALSQFASLLSASGYKKIPDPNSPSGYWILQWGSVSVACAANATTSYTWTLPITYPNAQITGWGCVANDLSNSALISAEGFGSLTAMTGFAYSTVALTRKYNVFSFGY